MPFWKQMKAAYDYRSWPLLTGYQKLYTRFGFDAMNYGAMLFQLFVIYLILWLATIALSWGNFAQRNPIFGTNSFDTAAFTTNLPYGAMRGIVWTVALVMVILWARFVGYQRQYFDSVEKGKVAIEDLSLAILNVPKSLEDADVREFLNWPTQRNVLRMMRVRAPNSIKLKKKLQVKLRHFHDILQEAEHADGFDDEQPPTAWVKVLQFLGFRRNRAYYERGLKALQAKIKQKAEKAQYDTILVSLDTPVSRNLLVKHINSHALRSHQMHAIKAPRPDDIYLENLVYEPVKQCLRFFFSILIIVIACVVLFLLLCWQRYMMQKVKTQGGNLAMETVKYYFYFLLTYVADWVFRPLLYWAQGFERHYSYTSRETFWVFKLYFYQVMNKMSMFYSRQLIALFNSDASMFKIFGYDAAWRDDTNHGGADLKFYLWVVGFGYNVMDLLLFAFYHAVSHLTAKTKREKLKAFRNLPLRYASKYVYLLVVLTLLLCFGHLVPVTLAQVLIYFPLQSIVHRFLLLRATSPPTHTSVSTLQFKRYVYVACLLAGVSLVQSYWQIGRAIIPLCTVLPVLVLTIVAAELGAIDPLICWVDERFQLLLRPASSSKKLLTDTNAFIDDRQWYQLDKPVVAEEDLLDADSDEPCDAGLQIASPDTERYV